MNCKESLEICADIAAIATPVVGVVLWGFYQYQFCRKKKALGKYLKKRWESRKIDSGEYQFSFQHLIAELGLTESEILQASFGNRHIERVEKLNKEGFTDKILFQYKK